MPSSIRSSQKKKHKVHRSPRESFLTHSNYLQAIYCLILGTWPYSATNLYENIAKRIASSGLIQPNLGGQFDMEQVKACLQSAWGTEVILLMTGEVFQEEESICLSNNWLAIQTYYVMYHCTQALHVAQGHLRLESHPKTQNAFRNQWVSRPGLLHPWTVGYGPSGTINLPTGVSINDSVHVWSSCEGTNIWNLFAKALKTTRHDEILEKMNTKRADKKRERRQCWEKEEAKRAAQGKKPRKQPKFALPRLTSQEKEKIEESTRIFTLIDYMYRLRIKTNYEDSNMFVDGPEHGYQSEQVRSAFYTIASGTLFLYEHAIKATIGRESFMGWARSWTNKNLPIGSTHGIAGRFALH